MPRSVNFQPTVEDYARIKLLEADNIHLRELIDNLNTIIKEKDKRLAERDTLMRTIKDIIK